MVFISGEGFCVGREGIRLLKVFSFVEEEWEILFSYIVFELVFIFSKFLMIKCY